MYIYNMCTSNYIYIYILDSCERNQPQLQVPNSKPPAKPWEVTVEFPWEFLALFWRRRAVDTVDSFILLVLSRE